MSPASILPPRTSASRLGFLPLELASTSARGRDGRGGALRPLRALGRHGPRERWAGFSWCDGPPSGRAAWSPPIHARRLHPSALVQDSDLGNGALEVCATENLNLSTQTSSLHHPATLGSPHSPHPTPPKHTHTPYFPPPHPPVF